VVDLLQMRKMKKVGKCKKGVKEKKKNLRRSREFSDIFA
jgi:hypothetical protein